MIILGIDPGSTRPGYGVIKAQGNRLEALDFGLLEKEAILKASDLKTQLLYIYESAQNLIQKYKPQLIGLENLFFSKNTKTAFSTASVRAVIMLCSAQHHIDLLEPTPLSVKKGLTGHATSNKDQVAFMVTRLLGLKDTPKPDDVTDALAIAIASYYSYSNTVALKS